MFMVNFLVDTIDEILYMIARLRNKVGAVNRLQQATAMLFVDDDVRFMMRN